MSAHCENQDTLMFKCGKDIPIQMLIRKCHFPDGAALCMPHSWLRARTDLVTDGPHTTLLVVAGSCRGTARPGGQLPERLLPPQW